jgi:formamidopyrimidine-DNA glycosylase
MPELPEVETMIRGIRPFVAGRRIAALEPCPTHCKPITLSPGFPEIARRVVGQTVVAVNRRAKRCLLELEGGDTFVIEPRMTGLLLLDDPPDPEHLRLQWRFTDRRQFNSLWFWDRRGLGTVRLYTPQQLADQLESGKLGRDALQMSEADWSARCRATSRPIKVALLDQKFAAGIGNLYASEILHRSRIHPAVAADRLSRQQIQRLAERVLEVLEEAIRHEGSTLGDGTYRNALNQTGSYQNVHRVYQRTEETCRTCRRGKIQRIVQAQRATFFCPVCQRLPKPRRQGTR